MTDLTTTKKDNLWPEPSITRRGVPVYEASPFCPSVQLKTKRITNKRGDMMLINNSGEIAAPIAGFWESEEVDSTQFIKLYVGGVKALSELTSAGTKVFEIMYQRLQEEIGRDKIYLSWSSIDQHKTPLSESVFRKGLRELIEKRFLAPTVDQCWYWTNPDFVFNGDRLAFVKEYRRKGTKLIDPNQQQLELKQDD